jgi:hypothetical protein
LSHHGDDSEDLEAKTPPLDARLPRPGFPSQARDADYCNMNPGELSIAGLLSRSGWEAHCHRKSVTLKITVDLYRPSTGQGVHGEEVDPVLNAVANDHPLGITPDELRSGTWPSAAEQPSSARAPLPRVGELEDFVGPPAGEMSLP